MKAPLQTHFPSPLLPQVHEGVTRRLEKTNKLGNLVTGTLIWSLQARHNIKHLVLYTGESVNFLCHKAFDNGFFQIMSKFSPVLQPLLDECLANRSRWVQLEEEEQKETEVRKEKARNL